MKKYGFIFDMDGVIVDSNPYHKISLKQFCAKYGYDLTEEDLLSKIYGRTNRDWITNVFGQLPSAQLEAYTEEKEALYRRLYDQDVVALPGLHEFLNALEKLGMPKAIGTSAPQSNVDFTLSKTGTTHFFQIILKDTDITHGKPNPEVYIKTALRLGIPPEDCIVFEDSLSGIAAGEAAGMKVVGIATTHSKEELAHTDFVATDFTELEPLTLIAHLFENKK